MYAVEVDGNFHNEYNKFFHKNRIGFLSSIKRDQRKESFFDKNSLFLIRINEDDYKYLSYEWITETFNIDIKTRFNGQVN
jgi:hypothetical protein